GAEQRAGNGAGPEAPRLVGAARRQGPDEGEARRLVALLVRLQPHWKGRRRQLGPGLPAVVGAVQLGAEVAEIERRVERAVAAILEGGAHRIAEEAEAARRLPPAAVHQE